MYEQHFGFSSPMFFPGLAQDDAVFRSAAHLRMARDLGIALGRRDAVAIFSGPPGTGKSTLAGHALREISEKLAFACISHVPLTAHELLEQLLLDFGFEPYKLSRVERLQTWRQFLLEMAATATRVCVLVEASENIDTVVLQALHSYTVADAMHCPGANLILTTARSADELLSADGLEPLRQRVRLRRRIAPLAADETRAYLAFKSSLAGTDIDRVLAPGAGEAIHSLAAGVYRVVDSLLESSLRTAAATNQPRITSEIVRAVAADQFGLPADDAPADDVQADTARVDAVERDDASAADRPAGTDIPTLTDPVPISEGVADTHLHLVELDAIATAERLEDLSRSMAETIFGDRELNEVVAAMARHGLA